jgi:four helix bundle protein
MSYVSFENLAVYRLSEKLSDYIWPLAAQWQSFEQELLGKSLIKAADQISLHIVSGHGRESRQEQQQYARLACIAYNETRHWLRRAYKRKLLTGQDIRTIGPIVRELGVNLNTYLRNANNACKSML